MIASISGFLNLNNLDMTSDANDVIVIRHPDGRLHSTPFNVRFGKVKVLRPSEKAVLVEVNGVMTSAVMKMGPDGEAFWLSPTGADMAAQPESPVLPPHAHGNTSEDYATPTASTVPDLQLPLQCLSSSPASEARRVSATEAMVTRGAADSSNTPLIEEDPDGHLKVSAGARSSLKDVKEVHLVEETVEAAERAMRCVAEMSFEDDDYMREMVLRDKATATVTCFSSAFKDIAEVSEMAERQTDAIATCAVSINETSNGETQQNAHSTVSLKDRRVDGNTNDDDKLEEEKLIKDQAKLTFSEGDPGAHGDASPSHGSFQDKESKAASDVQSDALEDDYIFEDATRDMSVAMYEFMPETANCDIQIVDGMETLPANTASSTAGFSGRYEDGISQYDMNVVDHETTYFVRSLIPIEADLQKLNLQEGHNRVRYITHSALRGEVAVEASIYLWKSKDRLVVSDIDGTVTKSDLWGHLMPLLGRDWTHDAICSLYSRIHQNGYRFVYLTARSVSQISMTRRFLWNIEQDGYRLPKGPVLTAPQRFFTAFTQEVSKKSHLFKIACLQSVLDTFPANFRPFYAGFGNRFNDVVSYTAVNIPRHKIFIIDPNSVLHVYNVKQTYKDLTHLVDVTFPPVENYNSQFTGEMTPLVSQMSTVSNGLQDTVASNESSGISHNNPLNGSSSLTPGTRVGISSSLAGSLDASDASGGENEPNAETTVPVNYSKEDVLCDQEFDSFFYWRVPPKVLIAEEKDTTQKKKEKPKRHWLRFSLGSGAEPTALSPGSDRDRGDASDRRRQSGESGTAREETTAVPVPSALSAAAPADTQKVTQKTMR